MKQLSSRASEELNNQENVTRNEAFYVERFLETSKKLSDTHNGALGERCFNLNLEQNCAKFLKLSIWNTYW